MAVGKEMMTFPGSEESLSHLVPSSLAALKMLLHGGDSKVELVFREEHGLIAERTFKWP